tara:strand:+ start:9190 stop:9612 length:423 start_codon:yes stop_codon:yes gene_type:complete
MLYQWDLTRIPTNKITERYLQTISTKRQTADRLPEPKDDSFANELFEVVTSQIDRIDKLIGDHAAHWRLDRMSAVDRNILRLAVAELINNSAASAVVIDEAIQVGQRFSTQESGAFLNGVLDSIRKSLSKERPTGQEPCA